MVVLAFGTQRASAHTTADGPGTSDAPTVGSLPLGHIGADTLRTLMLVLALVALALILVVARRRRRGLRAHAS